MHCISSSCFLKSIVHLYSQQIFKLNTKFSPEIIHLYLNFIEFIVENQINKSKLLDVSEN